MYMYVYTMSENFKVFYIHMYVAVCGRGVTNLEAVYMYNLCKYYGGTVVCMCIYTRNDTAYRPN